MFFKKNKSNPTPIDTTHPSNSPRDAKGQASLFAPALNPNAQPIDFGFGRTPQPSAYAFQEPSFVPEASPVEQISGGSGWTPQFEATSPGFDAQQPMPELLSAAELSVAAPLEMATPALEPTTLELPMISGAGPSYLEETFENYKPEQYTPGLAADPFAPSAGNGGREESAGQQADDWNSAFDPSSWAPASSAGFSESAPSPAALNPPLDWATPSEPVLQPSLDAGLGDLMPWEQLPESLAPPGPSSPEALWEQFDSGAALPGQQVPTGSGAFLDSVHEKLYPEDPFTPGFDELAQGQQAFEEAAQFLFPDTMGASLDWQPETSLSDGLDPFAAQALSPESSAFAEPPLELGPSIQSDNSEVSDMTTYADALPQSARPSLPSAFSPDSPEHAFSSVDESQRVADALQAFDPFEIPAWDSSGAERLEGFGSGLDSALSLPPVTSFDPLGPDALDFDPFSVPPAGAVDPLVSGSQAFERLDSAFDLSVSEFESPASMPFEAWDSNPPAPEATAEPTLIDSTALAFDPFSPPPLESGYLEAPTEASGGPPDVPIVSADEAGILWPGEPTANAASAEPAFDLPLPVADDNLTFRSLDLAEADLDDLETDFAADLSDSSGVDSSESPVLPDLGDQDFYATDFTLNALGELVPVEPEAPGASFSVGPAESGMLPVFEAAERTETYGVLQAEEQGFFGDTAAGAEPEVSEALPLLSEPVRPEALAGGSPFQKVSPPPIPGGNLSVASSPEERQLNDVDSPDEQSPAQAFSGPLEAQWHDTSSEVVTSAVQPSQVAPPREFSLSDIQILSVCPLFGDRRLLVVSSNGIYALMGQVGLQQPQVAVLKLFDHNPLAYQNTFTAVAEAHADSQGMFLTQAGTWRGIISTFQDKITLHTDLG